MSIRRYLFLLITGLVLVIALAQVALLFHFKNNVEAEVERRGKDFADRILKYTIDSIEEQDPDSNLESKLDIVTYLPKVPIEGLATFIRVQISQKDNPDYNFKVDLPHKVLMSEQALSEAIVGLPKQIKPTVLSLLKQLLNQKLHAIEVLDSGYRIRIKTKHPHARKLIKRHLAQQIEKMKQLDFNKENIKIETVLQDGSTKVWRAKSIRQHDPKHVIDKKISQISKLFNYVTFVIVITTLLSIILVFWLSKRFSQPLQQLINGFKQLEQGNFGIRVNPQGVEEVQQTINRFNTMSQQLVKLAEAEAKLQEQHHLSEISDVSKGIAHALRNPMHTIGLAIEQLQSDSVSKQSKDKLFEQIQSKITQLDKNINALLTITSDGLERTQTLSLSALIHDVVLELKQTHQNKNALLDIKLALNNSIKIYGAENEFRSILHTLIFNAYDASLDNVKSKSNNKNPNLSITITSKVKNGLVVINVIDQGSGIDPKIKDKLFSAHCSTKPEGAGMGLYISKKLIELHYNGKLTVENNLINGAPVGVIATCTLPDLTNKDKQ